MSLASLPLSIVGTLLSLFILGACKGRLVKRRWWRSGLEMFGIAGLAAFVGFLIGRVAGQVVR